MLGDVARVVSGPAFALLSSCVLLSGAAHGQSSNVAASVDSLSARITLGEVTALAVVNGRVALVDRSGPLVVVVGRTGTLVDTLGRKGAGPGEFRHPVGAASMGPYLLVLDSQLQRLTWFRRSNERWLATMQATPVEGFAMCAFANHIVTLSGSPRGLLTEYLIPRSGQAIPIKSFGDPRPLGRIDRNHPIVQSLVATGKLACGDDGAWVAHIDGTFGELRVYDKERNLRRHSKVPGFEPIDVRAGADIVTNSVPMTGKYDELLSAVRLGGQVFAIGVARHERGADGRPEIRGYRMIEMDTNGRAVGEYGSAGVIAAVDGRHILCFRLDPEPLVWRQVHVNGPPRCTGGA